MERDDEMFEYERYAYVDGESCIKFTVAVGQADTSVLRCKSERHTTCVVTWIPQFAHWDRVQRESAINLNYPFSVC